MARGRIAQAFGLDHRPMSERTLSFLSVLRGVFLWVLVAVLECFWLLQAGFGVVRPPL